MSDGHRTSIKDVATRAGVSPGTVSNVVNHPDRVTAATRRRVLEVINQTGYVPNASASRLRALANRAIGILAIDVGNQFQSALVKGAQRTAEQLGFVVMLCDGDRDSERMIRQIDFLESQRVAGVLATGSTLPGVGERLHMLRQRGVAMVRVDAGTSDPEQCSVAVDDVRGGEIVGEHLMSTGRRRITYVQAAFPFRPFDDRRIGLQRGAGDHVIDVVTVPLDEVDNGKLAVEGLIGAGSDAAFCQNDRMALGVLRELLHRGIRVPEDIAVVGYDDTELASVTAVPLTSISQPAHLVGATSARLLLEECTDTSHEHEHVLYQPELVVRASTHPAGST